MDYLGKPSVFTRLLIRDSRRRVTMEAEGERMEDPTLLILKTEDEVMTRGTQVVSGS